MPPRVRCGGGRNRCDVLRLYAIARHHGFMRAYRPDMISTYSHYITQFICPKGLRSMKLPGEHHFVAAYLVPMLFRLNGRIRDYIDPDGTKGIFGDVVYYEDEKHHLGIEVKLKTIRLTSGEFNSWIFATDQSKWPQIFIGVGLKGICVTGWASFRTAYIKLIQSKDRHWMAAQILTRGYGPLKSVDALFSTLEEAEFFPYTAIEEEARGNEREFQKAMSVAMGSFPRGRQAA